MHNIPWQSRNRQFSIFQVCRAKMTATFMFDFCFTLWNGWSQTHGFQFFSWSSNRILKMCENCLRCDLQLGLVYLSLAAMDIQWMFRKLLLKLSKIQNEFHSWLQICSIMVMNRDINVTTIKMNALLVSERIVLILFAVIKTQQKSKMTLHKCSCSWKRNFLVPLSRQSDAIFFHGDSNQILSERQTMPRCTKNVNREREASNWARSLLENN